MKDGVNRRGHCSRRDWRISKAVKPGGQPLYAP